MKLALLGLGIAAVTTFPALLLARSVPAPPKKTVIGKLDRPTTVRERFQDGEGAAPAPVVKPKTPSGTYRVIDAEFPTALSRAAYVKLVGLKPDAILDATDRFLLFFVAADDTGLAAMNTLKTAARRYQTVRTIDLPPPTVLRTLTLRAQKADEVVQGGYLGLTGKGVVVAVIDSGIDFRHPDFQTQGADGKPNTRIEAFWDSSLSEKEKAVGDPAPITYPDGQPFGTLYTREQLNADLRTATPQIGATDLVGHGTACAGIAVGQGAAIRKNMGVAPGADLIGIRLGKQGAENTYLLPAMVKWLDKVAGKRPLVVSCSFGGQYGPRNGHSVAEDHLAAVMPPDRPGRVIVVAAGNENREDLHARVTAAGTDAPGKLTFKSENGGTIEWIVPNDRLAEMRFRGAPGTVLSTSFVKDDVTGETTVTQRVKSGEGTLELFSNAGKSITVDAYRGQGELNFTGACVSKEAQVTTPGSALNVLTIGSYDWNDAFDNKTITFKAGPQLEVGKISPYSNGGPLRGGTEARPDFASPGQWWTAPQAAGTKAMMLDDSGKYRIFNGTSAATPYTAGICALLLEKKPALTTNQIRQTLRRCATSDTFTGTVPNSRWGAGKLDVPAIRRALTSLTSLP
ncbi:MAG: S8 family serine peptidase [Armatimonas sp.]